MSSVFAPRSDAGPRRRRAAPDLRLLLGVLLVVGSVAGVFGVVAAADRRVVVYVASAALSPGDRVDTHDVVERSVALDGADRLYLARGDIPAAGLIVTQPVAKGQLLPVSSFGTIEGVRSTSLVVQLATRVSGAVTPGAVVDLWSAPQDSGPVTPEGDPDATATAAATPGPAVLVGGAIVVRILDASGNFAVDSKGSTVEVLVPRSKVARVLQAIVDGDSLAMVPAGIPVARSGSQSGSGS
jgi:hypothetical protein